MMPFFESMILSFIEKELLAHSPEIQKFILDNLSKFFVKVVGILEDKLANLTKDGH